MTKSKTVFVQNWEESERGWGVRPDGFTVHTSKQQHIKYVAWYNETFNNQVLVPAEYTRVSGVPIEVEVDDDLFDKIHQATQLKRDDGKPVGAVHGSASHFSTSPVRGLKESDLEWPEQTPRAEPMCSSCGRNITDSPAGGCKTPKEHG